MICITHSADLDGHCSGAIIKKRWPGTEVIGYNYGQPFPWDKTKDQDVIMVDVSLPMKDMMKLSKESSSFTWIDHHPSAIKDFEEVKSAYKGKVFTVLREGVAACELAWGHCFPDEPAPFGVYLLGTYDVWRGFGNDFWESTVLPFQYGMRLNCQSSATFPVDILDSDKVVTGVQKYIENGRLILEYQSNQNSFAMKAAFDTILVGGKRAIMCNIGGANSIAFKSVYDPQKHDVMVAFNYNGKHDEYKLSIYSDKPDVNCYEIAKQFGGGGHFSAAGFQVKDWKEIIQ